MLALAVHYHTKYCPVDCKQPIICQRLRISVQVIEALIKKVGERHPVFQDPQLIIVGSLEEGTKIGFVDEADVALIMNSKYDKNYFEFNAMEQCVKLRSGVHRNDLPE